MLVLKLYQKMSWCSGLPSNSSNTYLQLKNSQISIYTFIRNPQIPRNFGSKSPNLQLKNGQISIYTLIRNPQIPRNFGPKSPNLQLKNDQISIYTFIRNPQIPRNFVSKSPNPQSNIGQNPSLQKRDTPHFGQSNQSNWVDFFLAH